MNRYWTAFLHCSNNVIFSRMLKGSAVYVTSFNSSNPAVTKRTGFWTYFVHKTFFPCIHAEQKSIQSAQSLFWLLKVPDWSCKATNDEATQTLHLVFKSKGTFVCISIWWKTERVGLSPFIQELINHFLDPSIYYPPGDLKQEER